MDNMDKHRKRIQALAAKAQSGTEAEMEQALKSMFDYANKHGLDVEEMKEDRPTEYVDSKPVFSGRPGHFDLCDQYGVRVIQQFAGVLHRIEQTPDGNYIVFFGEPVAVEFATWLRLSIGRRVAGMWDTYKFKMVGDNGGYAGLNIGNEKIAFYKAAYAKIKERMSFLIGEYEAETGTTDLVVNREAALYEALAKRGIRLAPHRHGKYGESAKAAAAGKIAGDMVDLGRGVAAGKIAIGHSK